MRKNLLKTLGSALLLTAMAWSASAEAPPGTITHKKWQRFSGTISQLQAHPEFPNQPSEIRSLTSIEDPSPNNGDNENYGTLMQGYIVPPVTGNYKFYISSDDASELYLSTDDSPANKVKIASEPVWNDPRQYVRLDRRNATNPENRSGLIALTAGQKYYIEVLHAEGTGGNNVSVAWDVPGEPVTVDGSLPIQGISTYASLGGITWTNLLPYETTPSAISRSFYAGVGGGAVTDLTNNQNYALYPLYPTQYTTQGKFEESTPDNSAALHENHGARLQALISPPETGKYDFYISADDGAALYLSTDENPNNKVLLAREPAWNGPRDFVGLARRNATAPENRSTTLFPGGITLQAGQKYYIEALMKEGGGGNNLSVAWAKNGTAITSGSLPISTVSTVPGVAGGPYTNLYAILPKLVGASDSPVANTVALTFNVPLQDASATNPANYAIDGGLNVVSAALNGDKQSVVLTLDGPLTVGQTYTVTASGVKDGLAGANPMAGPGSASFLARAAVFGAVRAEYYDNIGGTTVNDLLNSSKFQTVSPDSIVELSSVNSPAGRGDNYGVRITGYIIPTASGNYSFQLNSDDSSVVRLSGSANDKARVQLVRDDSCCANRDTAAIPLIGGRAYSIQALMKEGGGGDNLDLRWSGGDIGATKVNIDSARIAYMANPVTITTHPVGATIMEGQDYTFSVQAGGDPGFTYQWRTNGVDVPGANGNSFTLTYVNADLNGLEVSVAVQNYTTGTPAGIGPYTAVSSNAVLMVIGDEVKPTMVSATAGPTYDEIRVVFSEPVVDATTIGANFVQLTDLNFDIFDVDNSTPINIVSVGVSNNLVVVLKTETPLVNPGNPLEPFNYEVHAFNVVDASPTHNTLEEPAVLSFRGAIIDPEANLGQVLVERYENLNVNGWFLRDLTNNANYPWYPTARGTWTNMNIPQTGGAAPGIENFGYRARSFLIPSESGNYQFRVGADDSAALFLSTSSDPAAKTQIAGAEAGTGCAACGYANSANNIRLEAGKMYYIEAIMVEGGGGDWLNVQWRNNRSIGSFQDIPSANFALFVDPSKINLAIAGLNDLTTNDCATVTYQASVTGGDASYQLSAQWSVDGTPVEGATNLTFTTPAISGAGPHDVQLTVNVIGGSATANATVNIEGDPLVPTITRTKVDKGLKKIFLTFDLALDPGTAADSANYFLSDSENNVVGLSGIDYNAATRVVTINVDNAFPLQIGGVYNLHVENVSNPCGSAAVNADLTIKAPRYFPGLVKIETYGNPANDGGIGGVNVNQLTNDVRYPNSPRDSGYITEVNTRKFYPDDRHENYGGRMSGYFIPPATDDYIFYTKGDDGQRFNMNTNELNSTDSAAITTLIDSGDQCCQNWVDRQSAPVRLNAGQKYYFEALWKEGGGGDFQQVTFKPATAPIDDVNGMAIMSGGVIAAIVDDEDVETSPYIPAPLSTTGMKPIGSLSNRGFQAHLVQVTTPIATTTAAAEALLACSGGPNVAGVPRFVTQTINYNIPNGLNGHLRPETVFPGIPGKTGSTENMAMEALTYLELQPGIYSFVVNSDDGFRVSSATSVSDPNNARTLGDFQGGRGSSDTAFQVRVTEAGLYPFRLVWEQGGGGGNLEFIVIGAGGQSYAPVNEDAGIRAFLPEVAPVDTDNPVIVNCPTNRTVVITNACSVAIPDLLPQFIVADCSSVVTTVQDPPAGTIVNGAGTQVVTLTGTDEAGHSVNCTVTLTIVDGTAPVITACAANTTVAADENCQGIVPDLTSQVTATDGCGGAVTITQTPAAGASIPAGASVITLTATDAAGNSSTCAATVTVAPAGPAPALTISQSGANLVISWTSATPCWKLQASPSLSPAAFVTIEGKSPVTVPIDSEMKFFRLLTAPNP